MSTVQTIIDRGFAKSAAARPDTMAVPNELIARITQALREAFQIIARENPMILGSIATANFDGTGWPRPSDAVRVIKVVADATTASVPALAPGEEINVVPFNDQLFCEGLASLTEFGQKFVPVGQTMDPTGGTVKIYYARAPIVPTQVDDDIDALFPEIFDDFLQLDLAAYLAEKDERSEDQGTFLGLKNAIVQQMIEWCRGQTYNLQQRFLLVTPPTTNSAGGRQQPEQGAQ